MAPNFCETIFFMNYANALRITKILVSKFLGVLKLASYMNISRRVRHGHQLENFPVAASSICNAHDSVSIPPDPVYVRVFVVS